MSVYFVQRLLLMVTQILTLISRLFHGQSHWDGCITLLEIVSATIPTLGVAALSAVEGITDHAPQHFSRVLGIVRSFSMQQLQELRTEVTIYFCVCVRVNALKACTPELSIISGSRSDFCRFLT